MIVTDKAAGASALSGVLNLLNSIIGAGILALPFAFKSAGLLVGIGYQIVFGFMTLYGIVLLLESLKFASVRSYEDLALCALGRAGWYAYNFCSIFSGYGSCTGYLVIIGDILPGLLQELGYVLSRESLMCAVSVVLIFPLCALPEFSALQYASGLAVAIYVCFTAAIVQLYFQGNGGSEPLDPPPSMFREDFGAFISVAPLSAFAYQCLTTLFPIYQELAVATPARMTLISAIALGTAGVIYSSVGAAAYLHFGEATQGDVLLNLESIGSPTMRIMRFSFGISICFTYPTIHFACRRSLDQLLFHSKEGNTPYLRLLALTVLIVSSTLWLALYSQKVEVVFGYAGAIASTSLLFILPPAIALSLHPHKPWYNYLFLLAGLACGILGLLQQLAEDVQSGGES
jgi:amino acid permease